MAKKYTKKPVEIEAVRWTGDNWEEASEFVGDSLSRRGKTAIIETLEGFLEASPGDFIIQGIKGEYYPCKPDIFKETYKKSPKVTIRDLKPPWHFKASETETGYVFKVFDADNEFIASMYSTREFDNFEETKLMIKLFTHSPEMVYGLASSVGYLPEDMQKEVKYVLERFDEQL